MVELILVKVIVKLESFFQNGQCVRETVILVEQQPPQGLFVCDHAGLVINKFSLEHVGTEIVELKSWWLT